MNAILDELIFFASSGDLGQIFSVLQARGNRRGVPETPSEKIGPA